MNSSATGRALERLPGRSHYFIGGDPDRWRANVPRYGRIRYEDVYPGIDLVYYSGPGGMEFDFVLEPNADPSPIRLRYQGIRELEIDADGGLLLSSKTSVLRQGRPHVYQTVDGARQEVSGRYVLTATHEVSFQLDVYDEAQPLVIDPVIRWAGFQSSRPAVGQLLPLPSRYYCFGYRGSWVLLLRENGK